MFFYLKFYQTDVYGASIFDGIFHTFCTRPTHGQDDEKTLWKICPFSQRCRGRRRLHFFRYKRITYFFHSVIGKGHFGDGVIAWHLHERREVRKLHDLCVRNQGFHRFSIRKTHTITHIMGPKRYAFSGLHHLLLP